MAAPVMNNSEAVKPMALEKVMDVISRSVISHIDSMLRFSLCAKPNGWLGSPELGPGMKEVGEQKSRRHGYVAGETIPGTKYAVVRPIGAGGMGQVYDVEDVSVGRKYVLKVMHPDLCARTDVKARFEREARTLAQLTHRNIVGVFTAGVTGDALGLPYFVMERFEGESLYALLARKGRLGLQACYEIGIELLEALDCAHEHGIIHRDIKPDNIVLHRDDSGTVTTKLIDFGIMELAHEPGQLPPTGRFVGTPRYAAPEQVTGGAITAKTDLYSASLVLYTMLVGGGPLRPLAGRGGHCPRPRRPPHPAGAAVDICRGSQ